MENEIKEFPIDFLTMLKWNIRFSICETPDIILGRMGYKIIDDTQTRGTATYSIVNNDIVVGRIDRKSMYDFYCSCPDDGSYVYSHDLKEIGWFYSGESLKEMQKIFIDLISSNNINPTKP